MDNIERIEKLLKKNNGIITTREVEEIGINSRVLTRMIEKGIIHSNSIERFRKFSETMLRGQAEDSGNFIMRGQDTGCYGWVSMSYKMMYDDTGIAVRAIGIIDNLSNSFFSDSPETIPQRLMPEALLSDLILRMRMDITLCTRRLSSRSILMRTL